MQNKARKITVEAIANPVASAPSPTEMNRQAMPTCVGEGADATGFAIASDFRKHSSTFLTEFFHDIVVTRKGVSPRCHLTKVLRECGAVDYNVADERRIGEKSV